MQWMSVKLGFDVEPFVGSNLPDMYSTCGSWVDDEVARTAMIDGCAKNGSFDEATVAFCDMFASRRLPSTSMHSWVVKSWKL